MADPRAERFACLVVVMRADLSRYVARRLRPDEVEARRRRLSSHLERARAPVVSPTDEERLALVTAWAGLRPEERQVLEVAARVGAGKAAAEALGLSEDAVSARLHRARRRMLSLLGR